MTYATVALTWCNHKGEKMNFPHIEQIRHTVKYMEKFSIRELSFRGTTKVHGTNARILVDEEGDRRYGSKSQIIDNGHYGFFEWASTKTKIVANVPAPYVVYGEWAGKGIQSGVSYPKSFIIFAVYSVKTGGWYTDEVVDTNGEEGAHLVSDFGVYNITLSIDDMQPSVDKISLIVDAIERECPVAKALGFTVVGEGIVFVSTDTNNPTHGFKVKGEKHATTKVPVVAKPVVKGLEEFLAATVTEVRLTQGLEHFELSPKNTGGFIKWVIGDIAREDVDLIPEDANQKAFMGAIGPKAAKWFINKCKEI